MNPVTQYRLLLKSHRFALWVLKSVGRLFGVRTKTVSMRTLNGVWLDYSYDWKIDFYQSKDVSK